MGGHIRQVAEQFTPGYHLQKLKKAAHWEKCERTREQRDPSRAHLFYVFYILYNVLIGLKEKLKLPRLDNF